MTDDWTFCRDALLKLSRSFAVPIAMLPERLEKTVTCGYLLCRIADTVEDRADLELSARDRLYERLLAVLETGAPAETFTDLYRTLGGGGDDEAVLALGLGRVLRVLGEATPAEQAACTRWVAELTRGMAIYSHRQVGDDGVVTLTSMPDLERYCYFVAGTVGHMLTELFIVNVPELDAERIARMRERSESFGTGLQLVNILKDMAEDRQRGWSFIPATAWAQQGLSAAEILEPQRLAAAHRAVAPIFERATECLESAFEYTLALPPSAREARLFCLVPLWLAVATLDLARGNDDLFTDRKVKISRDDVARLVGECSELVADDEGLRRAYRALGRGRVRRTGATDETRAPAFW